MNITFIGRIKEKMFRDAFIEEKFYGIFWFMFDVDKFIRLWLMNRGLRYNNDQINCLFYEYKKYSENKRKVI